MPSETRPPRRRGWHVTRRYVVVWFDRDAQWWREFEHKSKRDARAQARHSDWRYPHEAPHRVIERVTYERDVTVAASRGTRDGGGA